jgi:hypothetical protein
MKMSSIVSTTILFVKMLSSFLGFAVSLSFSGPLICQESENYMLLCEKSDEYLMVLFNCGSYLSSCELSGRILLLLYYGWEELFCCIFYCQHCCLRRWISCNNLSQLAHLPTIELLSLFSFWPCYSALDSPSWVYFFMNLFIWNPSV